MTPVASMDAAARGEATPPSWNACPGVSACFGLSPDATRASSREMSSSPTVFAIAYLLTRT
jgi:hypothetical protein